MRTNGLKACIVALAAVGALFVDTVPAGEKSPARDSRQVETATYSTPEIGAVAAIMAEASADGCVQLGTATDPQSQANAFRGNVYSIPVDATVSEIKMDLKFDGQVQLTWSIHECTTASTNIMCTLIWSKPKAESGNGTRKVYSSGPVCIPDPQGQCQSLPPDKNYLIGVAWMGDPLVQSLRGLLQNELVVGALAVTVPLPEPIGPRTPFPREYFMEVCFAPFKGACCDPATTKCGDILEANCSGVGSHFFGELTSCTPISCQFGACCLPCGGCAPGYSTQACESAGGTWQGPGVTCPVAPATDADLCPVVTGACCHGGANATCDEICIDNCLDPNGIYNGVYLGDETTCDINPCVGACCTRDLGCIDDTEAFCTAQAVGRFKGLGTTCDDLDAADQCGGACCQESVAVQGETLCTFMPSRDLCTDGPNYKNSTYLGDTVACPGTPCTITGRGACCWPNGTCQITSQGGCDDGNGSFTAGVTNCANHCVTCCTSGSCKRTASTACAGTVAADLDSCIPNLCSEPTGACCFADASCDSAADTAARCEAVGGRFEQGSDCTACPGLGACCRPNETCEDLMTLDECNFAGGGFSPGETCTSLTTPCPQRRACCMPDDGLCYFILEDHCLDIAGIPQEEFTVCSSFMCQGACCSAQGVCTIKSGAACATLPGSYLGLDPDAKCHPDITCPTGACCTETGCQMLTEDGCTWAEGIYSGNGIACDSPQSVCPGACCAADGTCTQDSYDSCTIAGGTYRGVDTTCDTGTCPTGACCTGGAAASCEIRTEEGCPDHLINYAGDRTTCSPNICIALIDSIPPSGAIDARQRMEPDGSSPADSITVTFDGPAVGIRSFDFTIDLFGPPDPPPFINDVLPGPDTNSVILVLTQPLDGPGWTRLRYDPTSSETCLGALPADVDGDGTATVGDIAVLKDCISGVSACELWQCDIDRSGQCTPADILRAIDLLEGAGVYDPWADVAIMTTCPVR